jgi:hypothetical protein
MLVVKILTCLKIGGKDGKSEFLVLICTILNLIMFQAILVKFALIGKNAGY